jgi:hypothetical protein
MDPILPQSTASSNATLSISTQPPHAANSARTHKLSATRSATLPSKFWKRVRQLGYRIWRKPAYLLRAIGLRSINHLTRNRHDPEKPKVVLLKSFWIALSRCAVHLAPMLVFVLVSFVNCKSVYIGPGLSVDDRYDSVYLTLFQVAAKLQEILCLASLSTILLQLLRYDLLNGYGTPLGLVSSHLWFSQPTSLISPEYLAAAQRSVKGIRRLLPEVIKMKRISCESVARNLARIRLLILLLVFILLAAFIGPFTAVLLIPRTQTFPAGGTRYFLNATAEEMWPSVVHSDAEYEACFWPNATDYSVCPSGGYASFRTQRSFNNIYDTTRNTPGRQADVNLDGSNFLMLDPLDVLPAMFSIGNILDNSFTISTYAAQPDAYSVILLQTLLRDWVSATWSDDARPRPFSSIPELKIAATPSASTSTTYPITLTRCTQPQNLSEYAEEAQFRFIQNPSLMPYGWSNSSTNKTASILGLRRAPTSHVRAQWIPLVGEDFGPVSIGLLFELPWSQPSNSRLAIACTVAANWGPGPISRARGTDHFGWYVQNDDIVANQTIRTDLKPNDPDAKSFLRHIKLSSEWLDLLTPEAPDPPPTNDSWRPTTLENIFFLAGFETLMQRLRTYPRYILVNESCVIGMLDPTLTDMDLWAAAVCSEYQKTDYIEWTIASLVSDGLSRRLSHRAFDTSPDLRSWIVSGLNRSEAYNARLMQGDYKKNAVLLSPDPSLIVQSLIITVEGLGYRVSSTTDYLAMIVVGAYFVLASTHVVWTLVHRTTSSSWDTATELMLLAYNSPPPSALRGTSAQVHRWDTYNRVVRVRAEQCVDGHAKPQMHLRLLVDDEPDMEGGKGGLPKPGGRAQADPAGPIDVQTSANSSQSDSTLRGVGAKVYEHVREGQKYW